MASLAAIDEFLSHKRLAIVGVSRNPKQFANMVFRELSKKGYELLPINPAAETLEGARCYPSVASVAGQVDGVVVIVNADAATKIVEECAQSGIPRVWLHKGLGGPGAVSDEAVQYCREHGVEVVDGACPLMFAKPVGKFHSVHRFVRRLKGSLPK